MSDQTDFIVAVTIVVIGSCGLAGLALFLMHREGRLPPWRQIRRAMRKNLVYTLRHPGRFLGLD